MPVHLTTPSVSSYQLITTFLARCWTFFLKHHLPIGLASAVMFGAIVPQPGIWLSGFPFKLSSVAIFYIFITQGLKLDTAEMKDAFSSWRACLYGIAIICFISPLLSLIIVPVPLQPQELSLGLALFVCMPTTISTGVLFSREAGGHTSIALLICVVTNLLAILTLPLFIPLFVLHDAASVSVSPLSLLEDLIIDILIPLGIGKFMREFIPNCLLYIKQYDYLIKYTSSIALILLPFMTVSTSSSQIQSIAPLSLFLSLISVILLHIVLLYSNYLLLPYISSLLHLNLAKRKSLTIMCSQKTIAIAIAVLASINYDQTRKGILIVPCVLAHLVQTVWDSMVVNAWREVKEEDDGRRDESIELGTRNRLNELSVNLNGAVDEEEVEEKSLSASEMGMTSRHFDTDRDMTGHDQKELSPEISIPSTLHLHMNFINKNSNLSSGSSGSNIHIDESTPKGLNSDKFLEADCKRKNLNVNDVAEINEAVSSSAMISSEVASAFADTISTSN